MFGLYYILVQSLYILGGVELFAFTIILYTIYIVRFKSNIEKTTAFIISAVFSVLIALVILKKAEHFTLIWTIFVPIATIFVYGTTKGVKFTMVFYAIVFFLAYQGIDVWQNGAWNIASFVRFVLASTLLTILISILELGLENAHIALEKKREQEKAYVEQLTQYSITDPLTKLYNRRHLNQIFSKNFQVAAKHNILYAFVMVDLDFFKQYNDKYGHKEGDEVLIKISKILSNNLKRDSDYAFRVGGEEFACLIIAKNEENIIKHINIIRQEIEETKLITASFGICIIDKFDYENFDDMYRFADKFLYEAKENGRNQVVCGLEVLKKA
jgi:diguanylate cyclase (GGDEF)-like protein